MDLRDTRDSRCRRASSEFVSSPFRQLLLFNAPWQRCDAPFAPGGPRAELASWGDAGECISGSCMARIAATRARSTFPQRRPAGCCLRSGAGWPGWRGSECSRWRLLPSEVIDHVCGRLGGPAPEGAGPEQQHQGRLLLLRLWGWLEVPTAAHQGRPGGSTVE